MTRKWVAGLLASLLALAVGCSSAQPPETPPAAGETSKRGGSLLIASYIEPQSLDTRKNMGNGGGVAAYQVQQGLLTTDPKTGKPVPGLAQEMIVSPDGLTYTFKLRQGVKFHDGSDFTSADVKFTFDFLTGDRPGGPYVGQFKPFIKAVETPDAHTVIIRMEQPWADFPVMLYKNWATLIVSQKAVEAMGDKYGVETMIGTGPFKFKEWVKGESVTVVRNPDYWDPALPYLDEIVFKIIRDGSVRVLNMRTGDAHIAWEPPLDQLPTVKGDPNLKVVSTPGNPMVNIQFNTKTVPFNDARVRQAVYYALDRDSLREAMYGEYARVARSLFPTWHWMYDANYKGIDRDLNKARSLLADAGYTAAKPLDFVLLVGTDTETRDVGIHVQSQLKEAGINVTVKPLESAVRIAVMEGKSGEPEDYKASIQVGTLPGSSTDDYMFKWFAAKGNINRTYYNQAGGFQNAAVEDLISKGRGEPDLEKARGFYNQAMDQIISDAPMIQMLSKDNVSIVNAKVQDYLQVGTAIVPLWHVWLKR